jgi:hypothetical protein
MNTMDLIWTVVGFVLSLMIFSYLIGDNILFRFAASLFIGVSAGYVAVILLFQVVYPRLIYPLLTGTVLERSFTLIPLALSFLLFFKPSRNLSALGGIPFAMLIGAGAAFAIGGAVLGTILPQSLSTINLFDLTKTGNNILEGAIILVATVTTLMYFYFGAKYENGKPIRRAAWIEAISKVGQVFLFATLGAIYAGVFITAITALVGRIQAIWQIFELIK